MGFRRGFVEKLRILKRAGLEQTKANVSLLNSISRKHRK